MFLSHILRCDQNRLISQVFWAQERNPVRNDWVVQVKDDLKKIGLDYLSFENIKSMKKDQYKGLIKLKCKQLAF